MATPTYQTAIHWFRRDLRLTDNTALHHACLSAVRVVLEAPVGMKVVSAKGHTAHRLSDERVEFAPIDRLEPGVKVLYRIRLRGELPGDQRVTVSVESDDLRTPIRREESTRVFGDD